MYRRLLVLSALLVTLLLFPACSKTGDSAAPAKTTQVTEPVQGTDTVEPQAPTTPSTAEPPAAAKPTSSPPTPTSSTPKPVQPEPPRPVADGPAPEPEHPEPVVAVVEPPVEVKVPDPEPPPPEPVAPVETTVQDGGGATPTQCPAERVEVAATKEGLSRVGAEKCKLCHKVQYASWMESSHAACSPPLDCEACHGAGSEYKGMKIMKDLELSRAAGLVSPTAGFCQDNCHVSDWDDDLLTMAHAHKED